MQLTSSNSAPRQLRLALVNDLTGFGRCSLAVQLPLVSALRIQGCPIATAALSVHTGFPNWEMVDFTDHLPAFTESFRKNDMFFDGILTGFMSSAAQIAHIREFLDAFKGPSTRFFFDPVMGDGGRLYSSYSPELAQALGDLLGKADLVKPNLTEACQLLGRPYPANGRLSVEELAAMAEELSARGPAQVVITGLSGLAEEGMLSNYVWERGKPADIISVRRIGIDRSGTGDAFAAILAASLLNGDTLSQSVRRAADFLSEALAYTDGVLHLPWNWGLAFEPFLGKLALSSNSNSNTNSNSFAP